MPCRGLCRGTTAARPCRRHRVGETHGPGTLSLQRHRAASGGQVLFACRSVVSYASPGSGPSAAIPVGLACARCRRKRSCGRPTDHDHRGGWPGVCRNGAPRVEMRDGRHGGVVIESQHRARPQHNRRPAGRYLTRRRQAGTRHLCALRRNRFALRHRCGNQPALPGPSRNLMEPARGGWHMVWLVAASIPACPTRPWIGWPGVAIWNGAVAHAIPSRSAVPYAGSCPQRSIRSAWRIYRSTDSACFARKPRLPASGSGWNWTTTTGRPPP